MMVDIKIEYWSAWVCFRCVVPASKKVTTALQSSWYFDIFHQTSCSSHGTASSLFPCFLGFCFFFLLLYGISVPQMTILRRRPFMVVHLTQSAVSSKSLRIVDYAGGIFIQIKCKIWFPKVVRFSSFPVGFEREDVINIAMPSRHLSLKCCVGNYDSLSGLFLTRS